MFCFVFLCRLCCEPDISITLLEMNETLTKDLIFSRALSSLKEQYDEVCEVAHKDVSPCYCTAFKLLFMCTKFSALSIACARLLSLQAYSAREDLITQTKVSEQVRDFLLKKTERLKHQVCYLRVFSLLHASHFNAFTESGFVVLCNQQLGDTSVEKHRLERTARQDTKVKAALSKRIHMLEKSIAVRFAQTIEHFLFFSVLSFLTISNSDIASPCRTKKSCATSTCCTRTKS